VLSQKSRHHCRMPPPWFLLRDVHFWYP
jgi:hypothetical protein